MDGDNILNASYPELNGRSFLQQDDMNQKAWLSWTPDPYEGEDSWMWNGIRPITRNRVITTAAQLTAQLVVPNVFAQNSLQEEDRDAAHVMRELIEYNIRKSNYETAFLFGVISSLVNTLSYFKVDYVVAHQEIWQEGKKTKEQVIDDVFSGFQSSIIPSSEVSFENPHQYDFQKQDWIMHKKLISYGEAEAKYGEYEAFKYVQAGKRCILHDDGKFYDVEDVNDSMVEEVCYKNRRKDLEVYFVGGVYLGDPNPEHNPFVHRTNKNKPKYNMVKFGYEPIDAMRFIGYKSLVAKMENDQLAADKEWQMYFDASALSTFPPTVTMGAGKLDRSVITPAMNTDIPQEARAVIPKSRIAYVAPTYQQARDIAWEQLRKDLREVADFNESRLEIRLVNGSIIALRGWESIETLRGQAFDLIVIDEVAMMRDFFSKWQEVIRPTLTDTKGEGLFISTPKGFNHFYDLFNLQSEDEDYASFHYTTLDNPHIPPDEIEKARKELTDDRFGQEYLADFRKTEGLVYKEFRREDHIVRGELDEDEWNIVKVIGGLDSGFTNPTAALTIKKSGSGRYVVSDEWYKTSQTDAQVADYVKVLKWNECYPDPENAGMIAELKRRGVNVREVIKGKGSVQNGISVVRELFKANKLFIHESCKNLIWELETYSYPEKRADHNEEENPIKENDHAVDALRYALSMESTEEEEKVSYTTAGWVSRRR